MLLTSAAVLNADDRCRREPYLKARWELNCLHPSTILNRAVEYGLEVDSDDAGLSASDHVMQLCVDHTIDTPQFDLVGLAEHLAALADFIVWIIRTESAWERPADKTLGKETWVSSAFLNASGSRLRRVLLVDRWSEQRALAESHDWRCLETCIYGVPMDLYVVCLGANRDGRRHGPLTKGWLHPVAKDLRFQKRDGTEFYGNWIKTFREKYDGTREEWLEAMTADGVLPEVVFTYEVPVPDNAADIRALAERKLARIREIKEVPDAQLSVCDNPLHPCDFRSVCPTSKLPSEHIGFVRLDTAFALPR